MIKVLQKRAFEKTAEADNVLSIPIQEGVSGSNSLILHSKQLSQSHIGSPPQIVSPSHGPLSHLGISSVMPLSSLLPFPSPYPVPTPDTQLQSLTTLKLSAHPPYPLHPGVPWVS